MPIPATIAPEKYRDQLQSREFREGVAKALGFAGKASGARIERPELIGTIQAEYSGNMDCMAVWTEITGSDFEQMISAIKNRILDFVIQIETENPDAGEAAINSQPIGADKVQALVHNHFYAMVGNIAQGSRDFQQKANVGVNSEDLAKFVSEFTKHLDELNIHQLAKQKAEIQLATLKAQEDDPNPVIVSEAVRTLRNLTEGTIASLIANAVQPQVWSWISRFLQSFN